MVGVNAYGTLGINFRGQHAKMIVGIITKELDTIK